VVKTTYAVAGLRSIVNAMSGRDEGRGLPEEASASLLSAVFATSPDAFAVSVGGVTRIANQAMADLLGYDDPAELVGKPVLASVAPSSKLMMAELLRRRDRGEDVPTRYRVQLSKRDGSECTADVRSTSCTIDGQVHTLVILGEAQSPTPDPRGEDFYRAVFELNTAVKLLIDPTNGRIVDANRAAAIFYGFPLDALRSMRISDINTLTEAEIAAEMEAARTLRRGYFRFRHRVASGAVRHVEVHSSPVVVGAETLLFSIIFDVTERDALEEELRKAQRLEAVGRLAGGVAHDFNNLLTIMLTCVSVIERHVPSDLPIRPYVDDLGHAASRAAELTRDLLALSRRQVMQPTALDLNAFLETQRGLMQRTLGPKLEIVTLLDRSIPDVHADPGQMSHVVMNLALNARDAMPLGGTLTFRTDALDAPVGGAVPGGRWVRLTVADDGAGMDELTRARAFEPFFTTKPIGQGTGLGLSTVYGIVTQSGGHVTVDSEVGGGTRFTVYLPCATRDSSAETPVHTPEPPRTLQTSTVLLVDDSAEVREALATSLRSSGFDVLTASSADEALVVAAGRLDRIDIVVSDVAMPGRSGVELADEIHRLRAEIPVLLISGAMHAENQAMPQAVRFLQKPFSGARLARAILELLQR
jgi:two-component system, cell cycle sensor histidine kinase and response regulator CckA